MIPLSLAEVAGITGGTLDPGLDPAAAAAVVTGPVVIDSRRAEPGALFAALPGEHVDGHEFAAPAVAAGAVAVLASRPLPGLPAVVVGDVTAALGALARAVARRLPGVTIAGDHRVVGQDLDQGPHRPAGRAARPRRRPRGLLQQRDRPAADRAARRRVDPVPGPRDVRPGSRAHRRALRHRAAADRRGAERGPRARGRVRLAGRGGQGQGRAARGAARRRRRDPERGRPAGARDGEPDGRPRRDL